MCHVVFVFVFNISYETVYLIRSLHDCYLPELWLLVYMQTYKPEFVACMAGYCHRSKILSV